MTRPLVPALVPLLVSLLVLQVAALGGCRSAEVTQVRRYQGPPVQQPRRIYVFEFRSEDAKVQLADEGERPEAVARAAAGTLALDLARELEDFQIPVERRSDELDVPEGSVAIHGEVVEVDEGSRAKRVFIGFSSGETRFDTVARVYLRGPQGPEEIAEYRTTAHSGHKPGILTTLPLGMAVQTLSLLTLAIQGGAATVGELDSTVARDAEETAEKLADALQELFEINGWLDEDPDAFHFE